jgi:hypothetical protein
MKTGGALVVLLLVFLPLAAGQESALLCYDGPFESVLLNGCVDDCRSFETLAEVKGTRSWPKKAALAPGALFAGARTQRHLVPTG